MTAIKRIVLAGVLLSAAGCSGPAPAACETSAECAGEVCVDGACQPCGSDADCAEGYGAGATCSDGACTAACTAGTEGCACGAGDTCEAGLVCTAGACTTPSIGCEGCPCGVGSTCDEGLVCQDGVCGVESCPEGSDGCPCYSGGTCDGGLSCNAGTCGPCTPGTAMCECATGDRCDTGLACQAHAMCPPGSSACCLPGDCGIGSEGTLGCMCDTSDPPCGPGAVCRGGLCVCGDNFVGERCEIACPDAELMVSTDPVFNPDAGEGYWLCGHFAASEDREVSGGTYTLRGEVPITPTDGAVLGDGRFSVTSR